MRSHWPAQRPPPKQRVLRSGPPAALEINFVVHGLTIAQELFAEMDEEGGDSDGESIFDLPKPYAWYVAAEIGAL